MVPENLLAEQIGPDGGLDRSIEELDGGTADGGVAEETAADGDAGDAEPSVVEAAPSAVLDEPAKGLELADPKLAAPPRDANGPFLTPYSRRARVLDGFRVFNGAVSGELIGNAVILTGSTIVALLMGGVLAGVSGDAEYLPGAIAFLNSHPGIWTGMLTAGGVMSTGLAYRAARSSRWKTPLAPLIIAGVIGTAGCMTLVWLTLDPEDVDEWEWPLIFSTIVAPLLATPLLLTVTYAIFRKPQPYWDQYAPEAHSRRPRVRYLPPTPLALGSNGPGRRPVPGLSLGTLVF